VKKYYYFDYTFSFDITRLSHKLRRFLDGVMADELEKHGYPSGNYSVSVCFDKMWRVGDATLARENAFSVSVFDKSGIVACFAVSLVSDILRVVSVCNKTLYAVDLEKDVDSFCFEVSGVKTSISETEAGEIMQILYKAFINRFPIPCRVSSAGFPHVTFDISFSGLYDPPDSRYICSLLGFGATARRSHDPYRLIIDADFSGKSILALHDAVGRLETVKDMINDILIK